MEMTHGSNDLSRDGQIMICRPKGAFNLEGVYNYEERFVALVKPILSKPWGIFNDYSNFELGGPETLERIKTEYQWSESRGCRYAVFYVTSSMHEHFAKKATENSKLIEVEIFKQESAAMEWIRQKLASS